MPSLAGEAEAEMTAQRIPIHRIRILLRSHIRYEGTDTSDPIEAGDIAEMRSRFESAHRRRYGFAMPDKPLILEAASVGAIGRGSRAKARQARRPRPPPVDAIDLGQPNQPKRGLRSLQANSFATLEREVEAFFEGRRRKVPVLRRSTLAESDIVGSAIVSDDATTIVVEPGRQASLAPGGDVILERIVPPVRESAAGTDCDPIMLEVCNNRFMSIAKQMGLTLQNTAHSVNAHSVNARSVNIKERSDFSCALFDPEGMLVANAPHTPIHPGSTSESVRTVLRENARDMKPGDVFCVNAPYDGGTHLPDITVITPVFELPAEAAAYDPRPPTPDPQAPETVTARFRKILFFVAGRGHHADIGGSTPDSMPPDARTVEEEGILVRQFPACRRRPVFGRGRGSALASGCRTLPRPQSGSERPRISRISRPESPPVRKASTRCAR